jgi:hypothetical protein
MVAGNPGSRAATFPDFPQRQDFSLAPTRFAGFRDAEIFH